MAVSLALSAPGTATPAITTVTPALFDRSNLVAWCIVPFDAKKRDAAGRAEMLGRLGIKSVAYDWRPEHVPQFEAEIIEYQKRGLEYFAFWGAHEEGLRLFEKYHMQPQLWVTASSPQASTDEERLRLSVERIRPAVEQARQLGCKVALYNHGGWGGEPENLVALCQYLRTHLQADHVGIVYNLHHGHGHLDRFPAALAMMKPYLLCLNLNGMTRDGDKQGKKILAVGQGEFDLELLRAIRDSGYRGPIGIIGHTPDDDVEERLQDNLDGLEWLVAQLDGNPPGPKPAVRAAGSHGYSPPPPASKK